MHKKIFIVAGEPSGDYLGGKLINDLCKLTNDRIEIYGIGGPSMQKAGMRCYFDMKNITLIGISEVIPNLIRINKLINETVNEIINFNPDVVITIDSSGFTHRVNRRLKKLRKDISIVHYVAPPVWAWRPRRARSMHKFIDLLFTLFPFEPKYFEKYSLHSVFVGHPIAKEPNLIEPTKEERVKFQKKYSTANANINICFLPGSRISEIIRHTKVFNETMQLLSSKYGNINVIIPTLESNKKLIEQHIGSFSHYVVTDKREKALAMYMSNIAIAASGSVNLELAITGTPTIVIYKTSLLTYWIVKLLVKIDMVNIVNILLKEKVVPELLQNDCTAENIASSVEELISSRGCIDQQDACKHIQDMIKEPEEMFAAKEILNLICERKSKCSQ